MSDTTSAEVRYEDRERRLTFTWSGAANTNVQVLESGEKPLAEFALPGRYSLHSIATGDALALFEMACRAWRRPQRLPAEPMTPVPAARLAELQEEFERASVDETVTGGQLRAAVEAFLGGVPRG